jgi:transposase-like protein
MRLFDHFSNELTAQAFLEQHIWPEGPACPHCGEKHRLGRLNGASTPPGSFKCYGCRRRFNLRHDTILENCHVPLHVWLRAIYLLAASEQRWGAQRLSRGLGVSVRTAWQLKLKVLQAVASVHGDHDRADFISKDQRSQCDISTGRSELCADGRETGGTRPEQNAAQILRIDRRMKTFEDAAAQLPAADVEHRFVELLIPVIRFSPNEAKPVPQVDADAQFLLWDLLEP